nr:hypothetical protein Iba_chr04dCG2120 [Ipomoea batatas]
MIRSYRCLYFPFYPYLCLPCCFHLLYLFPFHVFLSCPRLFGLFPSWPAPPDVFFPSLLPFLLVLKQIYQKPPAKSPLHSSSCPRVMVYSHPILTMQ